MLRLPPGTTCEGGFCQGIIDGGACGPENCPGCCDHNGFCETGDNPNACGFGGQVCGTCAPGAACPNGFCEIQDSGFCGPQNCKGCCDFNGFCQPGNNPMACGQGGNGCFFCPPGSTCNGAFCEITDGGACGPQNCPGCCDANGVCQMGDVPSACGAGGQQCTSCPAGEVCPSGACKMAQPCNAMTCPLGCCDVNQICEAGFIDTACGSQGNSCIDCTQSFDTCDTSVTPRTCTNNQMQCPEPYPGCPVGTTTVPPVFQPVCAPTDLQNAQAACQNGANSPMCQSFFQFEQAQNPACYSCLKPFDVSFFNLTGIFLCVAPYVDSTCNQETGCASDCTVASCAMCPAGSVTSCEQNVEQSQCASYFQNIQCVIDAIQGPAFFCYPQGSFGDWLQQVGQTYCGQ